MMWERSSPCHGSTCGSERVVGTRGVDEGPRNRETRRGRACVLCRDRRRSTRLSMPPHSGPAAPVVTRRKADSSPSRLNEPFSWCPFRVFSRQFLSAFRFLTTRTRQPSREMALFLSPAAGCVSWVMMYPPAGLPKDMVEPTIGGSDYWANKVRMQYRKTNPEQVNMGQLSRGEKSGYFGRLAFAAGTCLSTVL